MKKSKRKKNDKEIQGRISALERQVRLLHEIILKQAFYRGQVLSVLQIFMSRAKQERMVKAALVNGSVK